MEEEIDYNKMRYQLDEEGYVIEVNWGCTTGNCIEYNGEVPEGYIDLEDWFENANLRAYKVVNGNLILDTVKNENLGQLYAKEAEENCGASKKYVNDTLKKSTAVVTDELATEKNGNDLFILDDAGNYEVPYLKIKSNAVQNIKVVSSNKNILGISGLTTTINGVEIRINADGTITLNGAATDHIEYDLSGSITNKEMLFLIKNNIDYIISGLTNDVSLSLYSFDGIDRTLIGNYANELINLSSSSEITQVTLNISSGAEFNDVVIAPQIEINNIASEFVKHEETKAYGILENNECTIEGLVSYKDKTIIMIDNDVESSIQYYRYKYINEKLVEIEINEEEVRSTLEEVNNTVEGQNQKISEVTQRVGELNSKISEIADITTSKESLNAKVEIEGINQSEPIYIKIHPIGENISYLYPHSNLFPSATLFPKVRTLRFTNTETNEVIDYKLPTDLLYYDDETYDEFILDYDMESCAVNKRVGYNIDGTTYALETPTTIEYEYPKIELTDGSYTVELLGYENAYLFVRLMAQNIYTTQFATKTELHSEIKQTVEEIDLSVNQKLENYSTTEEMNSAINVKTDSITSSVSRTYTTKTENANTLDTAKGYTDIQVTTAKSEIKQTTDSIQAQVNSNDKDISTLIQTANSISSEVSKKVGNDEIISKINQSAEAVQINANKISLDGKEINLTSDDIVIKSNNFNVDKYGNLTCENATIVGNINAGSSITGSSIVGSSIRAGNYDDFYVTKEGVVRCRVLHISNSSEYNSTDFTVTNEAQDLRITLRPNCISMGRYKTSTSYLDLMNLGESGHIYLNGTIEAKSFSNISCDKEKENIHKLNGQSKNKKVNRKALDIINDADVCEYNYKGTKNTTIGLVIGNDYKTPDEVLNEKKNGIDLYSMSSLSWKGLQEAMQLIEKQDKQIKQLQKEIEKLKKESE